MEEARARRGLLQGLIGPEPVVTIERFENVPGTQRVPWILAVRPTTVVQIQQVVRAAVQLRIRIRPIGAAQSWSPLFPDVGQLGIYLSHVIRHDGPRIELRQSCDGGYEVTALASVTTGELLRFQLTNGVQLPANVIFRAATVAGIISTMCHGTGTQIAQTVSDLVLRMRVIDGHGNLRTFDVISDGEDVMNAARGSLGLFGIIYDVTFRVTPASLSLATDQWVKARHVIFAASALRQLIFTHDSIEVFWFPMSDLGVRQKWRTLFRGRQDDGDWDAGADDVWLRTVSSVPAGTPLSSRKFVNRKAPFSTVEFGVGQRFLRRLPALAPFIVSQQAKILGRTFPGSAVQEHAHAVHFLDDLEVYNVWQMEFSFPLAVDCSNVVRAFSDLAWVIKTEALQGRFPLNLLVELRVTKESDVFLSPGTSKIPTAGYSGHTFHLEIVSFAGTPHWEAFATMVARRWMAIPGATPHWAKQWSFIPGIFQYIRRVKAHGLDLFRRLHHVTDVDPHHIFFNATLENLIQPSGATLENLIQPGGALSCQVPANPCVVLTYPVGQQSRTIVKLEG